MHKAGYLAIKSFLVGIALPVMFIAALAFSPTMAEGAALLLILSMGTIFLVVIPLFLIVLGAQVIFVYTMIVLALHVVSPRFRSKEVFAFFATALLSGCLVLMLSYR